jgi:hypothetical protein
MENMPEEKEVEQTSENLAAEPREEAVEIELEGMETEASGPEQSAEPEEKQERERPVSDSKKRIDRLTKLRREAERREQDALKYAESVKAEMEQLKARMENLDQGYVQEYSSRVAAEMQQAEANLKQAISIGDTDAAVAAQKQLASLAIAEDRAKQAQIQHERRQPEEAPVPQPLQAEPQQPQQTQRADPKAEEWAEKNEWFGKDNTMTYAAFGIHKELVENEGFDPQSDEYYTELDKRIAEEFPHKFETNSTQSNRPVQTVASASRTAKSSGPKKVKLTPSQVAIAKKLGVPLEDYAKQVAMLSTRS